MWLGLGEPFSALFQSKVEDSYRIHIYRDGGTQNIQQGFQETCQAFSDRVHPNRCLRTRPQGSSLIGPAISWNWEDTSRCTGKAFGYSYDTGGPSGSTNNNPGVKRKRPVAKKGDDDEGDELDDDDEDDEASRPKKKNSCDKLAINAPTPTFAPTPAPPPPSKPTQATPPTSTPLPGADRMAALRRAKEAIAQKQARRPALILTGPCSLAMSASSDLMPNPQILPSPGQTYSFPAALPFNAKLHRRMHRAQLYPAHIVVCPNVDRDVAYNDYHDAQCESQQRTSPYPFVIFAGNRASSTSVQRRQHVECRWVPSRCR